MDSCANNGKGALNTPDHRLYASDGHDWFSRWVDTASPPAIGSHSGHRLPSSRFLIFDLSTLLRQGESSGRKRRTEQLNSQGEKRGRASGGGGVAAGVLASISELRGDKTVLYTPASARPSAAPAPGGTWGYLGCVAGQE
eukprot:620848-Prorocentrum_minimum.AAC.1